MPAAFSTDTVPVSVPLPSHIVITDAVAICIDIVSAAFSTDAVPLSVPLTSHSIITDTVAVCVDIMPAIFYTKDVTDPIMIHFNAVTNTAGMVTDTIAIYINKITSSFRTCSKYSCCSD